MPRFDRTGPAGAGPRTGWSQGRCGPRANEATSVADPDSGRGLGRGGQPWGGGRGGGFGGPGMRRGWGSAREREEDSNGPDTSPRKTGNFLRRRVEALEAQLARLKELFPEYSASEKQDNE